MNDDDLEVFVMLLNTTMNTYGVEITNPNVIDLWFELLKKYNINVIKISFLKHIEKSHFAPKPSDIIDLIKTIEGLSKQTRPPADAAWAMSLSATCESETVVWTEEMAAAFFTAKPVLDAKDKTGARMAFKSAYEKLCEQADLTGVPVKWIVSLGSDVVQRRRVIDQAIIDGKLPQSSSQLCHETTVASQMLEFINNAMIEDKKQEIDHDKAMSYRDKIKKEFIAHNRVYPMILDECWRT